MLLEYLHLLAQSRQHREQPEAKPHASQVEQENQTIRVRAGRLKLEAERLEAEADGASE